MLDIKKKDIGEKLASIYRDVRECCAAPAPAAGAAMGKNLKGDLQYAFDLNADDAVRDRLAREFQSGIVLSEESGPWRFGTGSPEYRFVVDPVDGSDNHKRGLPLSAFSLAVLPATSAIRCDQVLWGIVGFLEEDAPLIAGRGQGAFRGGERLRVSSTRAVSDAFISCELNHHAPSARLAGLLERARAVRSYGCASRAIALVASGAIDAHVDVRLRLTPESFLAAGRILEEAGGVLCDARGRPLSDFASLTQRTTLVAAATPELAEEIVRELTSAPRVSQGNRSSSAGQKAERAPLAVILAAGEGGRLDSKNGNPPKPARMLLGLSLAERTMYSHSAAGVERFLVVLGHRADEVRFHFKEVAARRGWDVDFVVASDWRRGNGASALAAAEKVGVAPFLLTMVDHLTPPSSIRRLLAAPPGEGEICLATDSNKADLYDVPDVTKVAVSKGRIVSIGKGLELWEAADTGVFYCTRALFPALRRAKARNRHGLSDGVSYLAEEGKFVAVDVTGESWLDIDTPEALQEARRRIRASLGKGEADGYISRFLNRPISRRLSVLLADTPATPDQITAVSFLISLVGAAFLAAGGYAAGLAGGLLVQAASVIDGCDGEVARLKHLGSPRGGWLDTVLDRYGDMAVALAVTYAYGAAHPGILPWVGGFTASFGFILASYVTKEFSLQHKRNYPNDVLNRLKRRDLRLLLICLGGIIGSPYLGLLAGGALAHVCVIGILFKGWRLSGPTGCLHE